MKVELFYFHMNGKFYTNASYDSKYKYPWDVRAEVVSMRRRAKLPGLVDGSYMYHLLVMCPEYEFNVPQLIPFEEDPV